MLQRARNVVGVPEQVRTALATAQDAGTLRSASLPVLLPDGRVLVRVVMAEPRRKSRNHYGLLVLGVAVAAGLTTVTILAVIAFIAWVASVVAWFTAHVVVIGAALAALLLLGVIGGRSACEGLHCGGCRR